MDTRDWITLGLGLCTVLSSGITSAVVTSWLNRRKDQQQFMRTKAETLYLASDEFGRALSIYSIPFFPLVKGEATWSQMREMQAGYSQKREHGGHETMTMLVEIYFPSVRPALAKVLDARGSFNRFASELEQAYRADGDLDRRAWMPRLNKECADIDTAVAEMKTAIVVAARTYAGVKQA
ncbi:hypothetical protein [Sphingopyxis sp. YF1]|uniref:hypothetical protein n=1 Tax=Sphingopyxis sp. YF1 TaxID=2482763 RepID=UPI001F61C480|nr:hypothetical protein [Sphingopyxis sp. YF1]